MLRDLELDHRPAKVAAALRRFWARHSAGLAWLTLILLSAAGFAYIQHQGHESDRQFCQLFADTSKAQITQYKNTVGYLKTPAGMEKTGLNQTISKITLPQLEAQIDHRAESFPSVCKQFGPVPMRPDPATIPPLQAPPPNGATP